MSPTADVSYQGVGIFDVLSENLQTPKEYTLEDIDELVKKSRGGQLYRNLNELDESISRLMLTPIVYRFENNEEYQGTAIGCTKSISTVGLNTSIIYDVSHIAKEEYAAKAIDEERAFLASNPKCC